MIFFKYNFAAMCKDIQIVITLIWMHTPVVSNNNDDNYNNNIILIKIIIKFTLLL